MKIQCQSCQAKYTIADEKVLGKVVKIRCKKCSSTIVINGNEHSPADGGGDGQAFDYASSGNDQWTVNVADGDQRTLTIGEIVAEYKAGVVNDETYCWKDGMADWLPLREIEAIYSALSSNGGSLAPAAEPARVSAPPAAAPLFAAAASPADSPFAAAPGNGGGGGSAALFGGAAGAAVEAAPAAARRAGGRAQGADLFGNVEKAGGEDDVMTSALVGGGGGGAGLGGASHADEKLTGQRNENSVLFSLSALTNDKPKETSGPSGNRTTATAEGSGLIDIRALSATMDDGDKKKNTGARVDDIMNLSGGGAFGAALAAPILAPPPLEAVDLGVMASGESPKQNKTMMFAILGGCAFIAIAIVAVAVLLRSPTPAPETTKTGPTGSVALPEGSPTVAVTAADPGAAAAAATGAAADNTPPPPGTGNNGTKAVVNAPPKGATGAVAAAQPKAADHVAAAAPAPEPPKPAQPASLADAMGQSVGKKADAPTANAGGSSAPFDRGAAAAALGKVDVQSCKKSDGPTGSGHVTVTFGPDGSVQSAVIDGGSFPGTPVGGCIAGKYRGAHVPPFGGAAVRVGKSFTVN